MHKKRHSTQQGQCQAASWKQQDPNGNRTNLAQGSLLLAIRPGCPLSSGVDAASRGCCIEDGLARLRFSGFQSRIDYDDPAHRFGSKIHCDDRISRFTPSGGAASKTISGSHPEGATVVKTRMMKRLYACNSSLEVSVPEVRMKTIG